jgi:predicted RND superfamily exporter protein
MGTPNALVVILEGERPEALERAVDRLAPRLADTPGTRSVLAHPPNVPALLLRLRIEPYLTSRDRRLHFLFVQPDDPESRAETIAPWVEGVREVLEDAELGAQGIRTGFTGLPQYALDDRDAVRRDLAVLSPLSLALILGLFVVAFTAVRRPLAAMAALAVAVGVTVGLAAVWPGHLTLLSAFFGSILFGLGVDFGIHLVDRTEEILLGCGPVGAGGGPAGMDEAEAVVGAVRSLAPALATGALTTASAFGLMVFSGFRGFAELGVIAGGGVLLCLGAMVTVLPALLTLFPAARTARPTARARASRLGSLLVRLQSPALAALLTAAALAGPLVARPDFDSDYLNLEPAGSEAVRWEREMVRRSRFSPQFAAFLADSGDEAAALAGRLAGEPTVGEVHALTSPDGRHAVYAHPKGDVWREEVRDRFLDRMQALDPEVTGLPVLGRFMIERSRRALLVTGALASVAILLWSLADLRDPLLALLAVLPTFLGAAAMLALMAAFGVRFNPLDVMALPVVLGVAVDDGVHIVHRFLAEDGDLGATLHGAGRSVTLTSLTSLAAFGVLALARHRGLASFGATAGLGIAAALVLSVLVLPQGLRLWRRQRGAAARRLAGARPLDG